MLRVGRELTGYHSFAGLKGLTGVPAPLLVQNGWTDDLFPAPEALRVWRILNRDQAGARGVPVRRLRPPARRQQGGGGPGAEHARAPSSSPPTSRARARARAGRSVTAYTQTCPADAPADGPVPREQLGQAPSRPREPWRAGDARRSPRPAATPPPRRRSTRSAGGKPCDPIPADARRGHRDRTSARSASPFTLLGLPTVRAQIRTKGRGGMIAARLWDVSAGQQTLVSRGIYRLRTTRRASSSSSCSATAGASRAATLAKLELVGSDPKFVRTSNFSFSVKVSKLSVDLPTSGPG